MDENIGKKFGQLTVIELSLTKNKYKRYNCICDCGKTTTVRLTALNNGSSKSCGCARYNTLKRKCWTGYEEISGHFWNHIKNRAKKKGQEITISLEHVWELFLKQDRKCAYLGIEIYFPKTQNEKNKANFTASLDRIDSSKGYIEGNVQWIHKDVNTMKMNFSNDYFINICSIITKNLNTIPNFNLKNFIRKEN